MSNELYDFLTSLYVPSPTPAASTAEAKSAYRVFFQSLGLEYCNYAWFELGAQGSKVSEISDTNMPGGWIEEYLECGLSTRDFVLRKASRLSAQRPYDCFDFGGWTPKYLEEAESDTALVLNGAADAGMQDAIGMIGFSPVSPGASDLRFFGFGLGGEMGSAAQARERISELKIATFALIDRLKPELAALSDGFSGNLTERERDVLGALSQGLHRDQIAHKLGISVPTVDMHAANLRKKLKAQTLAEAVAKGYRFGLL